MIKTRLSNVFFLFILLIYLSACGLAEYRYLPQVPLNNVDTVLNISTITLDDLISDYSSYSPVYSIYYKIYISDELVDSQIHQTDLSRINNTLLNDYNSFTSVADPANFSSLPNASTFKNRNYHELDLEGININSMLSGNGGTITIFFPLASGESPTMTGPAGSAPLFRNSGSGANNGYLFSLEPDRYFMYSYDLVFKTDYPITEGGINNDVSLKGNLKEAYEYAYVSMYVVAAGVDVDFSRILSKPTHIGVFKLP